MKSMMSLLFKCTLIVLGSTVLFTEAAEPKIGFENNFYDANFPINGTCVQAENIYFVNSSYPCSGSGGDPAGSESSVGDVKSIDADLKSFVISSPVVRVYNIYCVAAGARACGSAIMFNLSVSADDGQGLSCDLHFGADSAGEDFRRPNKVEWLRGGSVIQSKDLGPGDFESVGDTKRIISLLAEDLSGVPGEYECRFTNNMGYKTISKTYMEVGKPKGMVMQFSPRKEQYTDGDNVTLNCSFSGYPPPTIKWYLNDELLNSAANSTTDSITFSTIVIDELEDSRDRGEYKCVATNMYGNATISRVLHARDKLAALWPFLGIVVQVIVLAICIALGEKVRKRNLAKKRQLQFQLKDEGEPQT